MSPATFSALATLAKDVSRGAESNLLTKHVDGWLQGARGRERVLSAPVLDRVVADLTSQSRTVRWGRLDRERVSSRHGSIFVPLW